MNALPSPPPPGQANLPPEHPRATIALVLGIVGMVTCTLVSPVALVIGRRTVREIDASGGALGGRSTASAGSYLGLAGTIILGLILLVIVVAVVAAAAS